eukprot:6199718-Pleurochrysis_carterae.AAC.2
MRQIRGRPSDPMVAYPGGGWQYTTSRVPAPSGGMPRRSPSVSCASPLMPPVTRVRAGKCRAWLRRKFDQSQGPRPARSPGRTTLLSWSRPASSCTPRLGARGCGPAEPGRRIGGHGLLARLGGFGGGCGGECAASRSAVDVAVSARRSGEKRGVV